jgi:hypothetical protein
MSGVNIDLIHVNYVPFLFYQKQYNSNCKQTKRK